MTGSLQIKNDRYYMVINEVVDGKRKQKWISTGLQVKGNKRKAESMLDEKLYELRSCTEEKVPCEMLFADMIRKWLSVVKGRVDIVTYHGYVDLAENHIIPYFAKSNLRLCDLTKSALQQYIDVKSTNGNKRGGGLSVSSLRLHKNVINQSLKMAVQDGFIQANVCEGVTLPKKDKKHYSYYTAAQISELLDKTKGDILCPIIKMTSVYGLRRSEVLGLKWAAVDFDNDLLTIQHTVTKVYSLVEKDKTKNRSSYRSYPLLPDIKSMLLDMRVQQKRDEVDFGDAYVTNDYIFRWPDGRLIDPDYVTHHFSDLLKKAGMPHIRFHELRHSCASILIISGFTLKDVQEWLGHSNIEITADIYSHLDFQRKKELGEKMVSLVSNPTVGVGKVIPVRNPLENVIPFVMMEKEKTL